MTRKLFIALHIYKTAGQTLGSNFRKNFRTGEWLPMYAGPIGLDKTVGTANPGWDGEQVRDYVAKYATSKTKCISGHMAYFGIHNLVDSDREPLYIVFLRDPVERVASLYYYLKNKSTKTTNYWYREIAEENWSIEEWLENSKALWITNGQLRQLLLDSYDEVLTEPNLRREHLEEGKRRLQQFWFVGLTETFHEDSHYVYGKLGFWRFHSETMVNITPGKKKVSSRTRDLIAERNTLDIELYQFAKELHADLVNKNIFDFQFNKNKAIIMRSVNVVAFVPRPLLLAMAFLKRMITRRIPPS
jgi:hypothetical protein